MNAKAARSDSESLKRLEQLRPAYERLRAERIRAEGEIERLARELDEARRLAREELGTDDPAEIRRMIDAAQAENAAAVAQFAETVQAIEARIARLGEGA